MSQLEKNQAELLLSFTTRMSKKTTDRKSELEKILSFKGSFCIFSECRNGTTTMLEEISRRVGGILIDCMSLDEDQAKEELEERIGEGSSPVLLDEATCLFRKLGGYRKAIDQILGLSEKRRYGLRIHPDNYHNREDLISRGFEIIELKKIPFEEFKFSVKSRLEDSDFLIPDQLISYAHDNFELLAEMNWFIGEALELNLEFPKSTFSSEEIRKSLEQKYCWFPANRKGLFKKNKESGE